MGRPIFLALGITATLAGLIGIFLPLLPTTPFLLVALWAFGRSSPVLADRLRNHARLGPYVKDWEERRAIPLKAKILAISMMAASLAWLVFATAAPDYVKLGVAIVLAGVAIFITTRPSNGSRD